MMKNRASETESMLGGRAYRIHTGRADHQPEKLHREQIREETWKQEGIIRR